MNEKEVVRIRQTLLEMDHPHQENEIITDNLAAHGILNKSCKQVRSKAIDMNYYWVRDRIVQKLFKLIWRAGAENLADYFTKHHSPAHHKKIRPIYLHCIQEKLAQLAKSEDLRGCVDQVIQPNNKASIKSSLRSPIMAPKRLVKEKMVNLISGAKKVK